MGTTARPRLAASGSSGLDQRCSKLLQTTGRTGAYAGCRLPVSRTRHAAGGRGGCARSLVRADASNNGHVGSHLNGASSAPEVNGHASEVPGTPLTAEGMWAAQDAARKAYTNGTSSAPATGGDRNTEMPPPLQAHQAPPPPGYVPAGYIPAGYVPAGYVPAPGYMPAGYPQQQAPGFYPPPGGVVAGVTVPPGAVPIMAPVGYYYPQAAGAGAAAPPAGWPAAGAAGAESMPPVSGSDELPSLEQLAATLATASLAVQAYASLASSGALSAVAGAAGAATPPPRPLENGTAAPSPASPPPPPAPLNGAPPTSPASAEPGINGHHTSPLNGSASAPEAPTAETGTTAEDAAAEALRRMPPSPGPAPPPPPPRRPSPAERPKTAAGGKGGMQSGPKQGDKVGVALLRCDGMSCTREQIKDGDFHHAQPSTTQMILQWDEAPCSVLLLKKLGHMLLPQLVETAWMLERNGVQTVFVEGPVMEELELVMPGDDVLRLIKVFNSKDRNVDFTVCLGGDGVILHASSLFPGPCPPILGFNLGSMGFLAPHAYKGAMRALEACVRGDNVPEAEEVPSPAFLEGPREPTAPGLPVTLRMRLHCEVLRAGCDEPEQTFEVLNELVMDRGPSSFLSMIECLEVPRSGNGGTLEPRLLTKVQADGVLVATPTGSTAYSVSAGGSMMHPSVPAILVTPICPHSLSFRPVILPDSAVLQLRVPADARSTAWVCFDGKSRQELHRGDSVRLRMSEYPVPTVNLGDEMHEFVGSLVRCLSWNDREEQKPMEEEAMAKYFEHHQ